MTKVEAFVAPKTDGATVEGFADYSSSSSLHGIRFVGSKGLGHVQRTFWGLLICFSTAALLWQIVDTMIKYHKYESYTSMEITNVNELNFPAITICNLNTLYKDLIQEDDLEVVLELVKIFSGEISATEKINSGNYTAANKVFGSVLKNAMTTIDKFIIACGFGNNIRNCSEYFTPLLTDKGLCFTYNSYEFIQKHGSLKALNSLSMASTYFIIDVDPDQVTLPFAFGNGIVVMIHDPTMYPYTEMGDAFRLGTGREVYINMKKVVTKNLGVPYSAECVKESDRSKHMQMNRPYSQEGCYIQCYYNLIFGCGHNCEPIADGPEGCTFIKAISCVASNPGAFFSEKQSTCQHCIPLCEETRYTSMLSESTFPNEYSAGMANFLNFSMKTKEEMHRRLIVLKPYFGEFKVHIISHRPVLELGQLFTNFGGMMGLYLGASILTVVELCQMILTRIKHLIHSKTIKH